MTPEQLKREVETKAVKAEIESLTQRVPSSVINGGSIRARSYKVAATAAMRAVNSKSNLPKLRELLSSLKAVVSASDDQINTLANKAKA